MVGCKVLGNASGGAIGDGGHKPKTNKLLRECIVNKSGQNFIASHQIDVQLDSKFSYHLKKETRVRQLNALKLSLKKKER